LVQNLLNTGTVFHYSADDKNYSDDLLQLDILDTEVEDKSDNDVTFEDED
jgi:hypothetical protein